VLPRACERSGAPCCRGGGQHCVPCPQLAGELGRPDLLNRVAKSESLHGAAVIVSPRLEFRPCAKHGNVGLTPVECSRTQRRSRRMHAREIGQTTKPYTPPRPPRPKESVPWVPLLLLAMVPISGLTAAVFSAGYLLSVLPVLFGPPDQEWFASRFREHRDVYERMREILQADPKFIWIQKVGGRWSSNDESPRSRLNEYINSFDQIESAGAFRTDPVWAHAVGICFNTWRRGFAGESQHANFCWLERPPADFGPGGVEVRRGRKGNYTIIEGQWYVQRDWLK
jgi:hypothetical protein